MESIRVGLIGYGYAGKTFHAPLILSVPGLALTVVGSSKKEVVQADLPSVEICPAADVTTHPDVDLVVIASPNDSHFPLAAAALRSGKDVVIDSEQLENLRLEKHIMLCVEHPFLISMEYVF